MHRVAVLRPSVVAPSDAVGDILAGLPSRPPPTGEILLENPSTSAVGNGRWGALPLGTLLPGLAHYACVS